LGSPVPYRTTCGFFGSTARSPEIKVGGAPVAGLKPVPLLMVFRKPPEARVTKKPEGSPGIGSTSTMRSPWITGPMLRHSRSRNGDSRSGRGCTADTGQRWQDLGGGVLRVRRLCVAANIPTKRFTHAGALFA